MWLQNLELQPRSLSYWVPIPDKVSLPACFISTSNSTQPEKSLTFQSPLFSPLIFPTWVLGPAILGIILKSSLSSILGFTFYQQINFYSLLSLKCIPSLYFPIATISHLDYYNNLNGVPLLQSLRIYFVQRIIFIECTFGHVLSLPITIQWFCFAISIKFYIPYFCSPSFTLPPSKVLWYLTSLYFVHLPNCMQIPRLTPYSF